MPRRDHRSDRRRGFWDGLASVLGWGLLLIVAALVALLVIVPRLQGGTSLTVLSGSMEPALRPGDMVAVRGAEGGEGVRIGDVITFQPVSGDPTLVTHRVVGKSLASTGEVTFTTRGDANDSDDPPIVAAQVKGAMLYRVPYVGYGVNWVGDYRRPLAIAVGAALVLYGIVAVIRPRRRHAAGTGEGGDGSA